MTSFFNTIVILVSFPLIYFEYGGSDDYSNKCSSQFENLENVIDDIISGQYASMKIHESTEKLHLACAETVHCFEKNIGEESDSEHQEWFKFFRIQIKPICDSLRYQSGLFFKCISSFQTTQFELNSNSSTFQSQNTFDNCELTDIEYQELYDLVEQKCGFWALKDMDDHEDYVRSTMCKNKFII
ncbi:hypothetical protein CRE_30081 [Caenorhabditis remanei]|uniref:Uncharacterized protein n=1 Tax=Caenorhabditis remanei TaxID=31234 RepID=E3MYC6_CAERE|nr:hypothetical protein CRE_30081 [Caenorhabditis remanei]